MPGLGRSTGERDRLPTPVFLGFPDGSDSEESACSVGALGWEAPLEKRKGYSLQYSESPLAEEPGGLQRMGSQRVGHD